MNDNHARATNADATDPASAATPTNRGTSATNTWLSTTITIPTGTPNCSQQAIALPAIPAAAHDDPLAAAVDTVYFAVLAYGDRHRDLLTNAANELAAHKRPP